MDAQTLRTILEREEELNKFKLAFRDLAFNTVAKEALLPHTVANIDFLALFYFVAFIRREHPNIINEWEDYFAEKRDDLIQRTAITGDNNTSAFFSHFKSKVRYQRH